MNTEFLANENFPRQSITLLRQSGYRVESIVESSPGISDEQVLNSAEEDGLTILTFDRDYGELLFKYGKQCLAGVVYFRTGIVEPSLPGRIVLSLLQDGIKFQGFFTVIDSSGIRQRPLRRRKE